MELATYDSVKHISCRLTAFPSPLACNLISEKGKIYLGVHRINSFEPKKLSLDSADDTLNVDFGNLVTCRLFDVFDKKILNCE